MFACKLSQSYWKDSNLLSCISCTMCQACNICSTCWSHPIVCTCRGLCAPSGLLLCQILPFPIYLSSWSVWTDAGPPCRVGEIYSTTEVHPRITWVNCLHPISGVWIWSEPMSCANMWASLTGLPLCQATVGWNQRLMIHWWVVSLVLNVHYTPDTSNMPAGTISQTLSWQNTACLLRFPK